MLPTKNVKVRLRRLAARILGPIPPVQRYLAEKRTIFAAWNDTLADRDRLRTELDHSLAERARERSAATAEREFLLAQIRQPRAVTSEQSAAVQAFQRTAAEKLIELISSGEDLRASKAQSLGRAVEAFISDPDADKIGIHREIGKALFSRSPEVYSGIGLPQHLVRYTYPPVISVALSSHCNAACFFCRDSDYKGTSINFDNIFKLESAIRNARTIDLTGWGEPFFYPRFEEVLSYIGSINDTKQLIQVTSNGSFLSEKWGRMLSGKLNRLIISLNAATPDTYADQMRYKNKKFTFDVTLRNIRDFQNHLTDEDRKRIFLHMVANTGNFREITTLVRLASDLQIPTVNVGNYICAHEEHLDKTLWNVKQEYNAEIAAAKELGQQLGVTVYGRQFFASEQEIKGAESCIAPFEQFFIEMEGTTAPCCFMGTERMGNVYEDGFEAIWFSDTMNQLRRHRFLPPCQVCTIFTPFDSKTAHMSAFLTTKAEEVVLGGGPKLGSRGKRNAPSVGNEVNDLLVN
ncbi:MAG: radical SAM protein [Steroidobacteraceae bacterium]|jgi:MoaA/NifB/PqqE/SkfB family radical SAM enzyme